MRVSMNSPPSVSYNTVVFTETARVLLISTSAGFSSEVAAVWKLLLVYL